LAYLERCTTTGCTQLGFVNWTGFNSVSALAANDIWIAGGRIWHWDGTTLTTAFTSAGAEVLAVHALASNNAWAVGRLYDGPIYHSLLVHWDGVTWSVVPGPDMGALAAVTARAANDVWAVGQGILHWDGVAWTTVSSPPGFLNGVTALASDDAWAVGIDPGNNPLILHYTAQIFNDVPSSQPFYPFIQWMACRTYISGYQCGGPNEPCPGTYFRPGANVTRGQLLKMAVNAAGWALVTPPTPTFADVDATHPFYSYIETGVSHNIISGYTCGGPGEPCDPQNRPYFRPGNNITRGQLAKVIALARGYPIPNPAQPTFADVPATHPFFGFIEAVAGQGIVSGYACGGPGEPCDGQNRPYFRAGNNATRGQVAKFVTLAYGGP
jgi:hypothetical protein